VTMRIAALAVIVASCSSGDPKRDACDRAVSRYAELHLAARSREDIALSGQLDPVLAAPRAALHVQLLDACVADAWSETSIACFASAIDFTQIEKCTNRLPTNHVVAVVRAKDALETAQYNAMEQVIDREVAAIKAIYDRMCACVDAACAAAVDQARKALVVPVDPIATSRYADFDEQIAACRVAAVAGCDAVSCAADDYRNACCEKLKATRAPSP
jgi:hypothetical protein